MYCLLQSCNMQSTLAVQIVVTLQCALGARFVMVVPLDSRTRVIFDGEPGIMAQCNVILNSLWSQVEFNKAALSLSDSIPGDQKKAALNRLLKVRQNIASEHLSMSTQALSHQHNRFQVQLASEQNLKCSTGHSTFHHGLLQSSAGSMFPILFVETKQLVMFFREFLSCAIQGL